MKWRKGTMKRFGLFISLLLASSLFFTACGGSSNGDNPQDIAINKIIAYAEDQTNPVPTVEDYEDAGVTGVTEENLEAMNTYIASLTRDDVDTVEKIQEIVDNIDAIVSPPVITLNGNDPQIMTEGGTYTEEGATATDATDGDLTSSIVVSGEVETETVGSYTITYSVEDSDGNTATTTRTVLVVQTEDILPPVITILGDNPTEITEGDTYIDAGATAEDLRDGETDVNATGEVDSDTIGTYTITYASADSAGNTATATRTVEVVAAPVIPDTTPPVVTLNGDTNVSLIINQTYVELNATATDDRDGNVTASIIITGTVDTSTAGTYLLTYTASDAAGNEGNATREVKVVRFTRDDNLNIVTDHLENRMWTDYVGVNYVSIYIDWYEAIDYCANLDGGWILPDEDELESIIVDQPVGSHMDPAFQNQVITQPGARYWTSTTLSTNSEWARYVLFLNGTTQHQTKISSGSARCMKDIILPVEPEEVVCEVDSDCADGQSCSEGTCRPLT